MPRAWSALWAGDAEGLGRSEGSWQQGAKPRVAPASLLLPPHASRLAEALEGVLVQVGHSNARSQLREEGVRGGCGRRLA